MDREGCIYFAVLLLFACTGCGGQQDSSSVDVQIETKETSMEKIIYNPEETDEELMRRIGPEAMSLAGSDMKATHAGKAPYTDVQLYRFC